MFSLDLGLVPSTNRPERRKTRTDSHAFRLGHGAIIRPPSHPAITNDFAARASFMAWIDSVLASLLHNVFLPLIVLSLCLRYALQRDYTARRLKFQAWLSNYMSYRETGAMLEAKEILFGKLESIVSQDWYLRNLGLIRILEIGAGSGSNLAFYPRNCHLVAVDSNPFTASYLRRKLARVPVLLEMFLVQNGGSLNNVKSCYVDAVVTTHVLCGVKDLDAVLKEIARVLAPGGKFFYVEHMRHDPGDWRRYVQMLVGPLWRRIFNGCSLTQELHDGIQKSAHFASVSQCKVYSARSKFVGIFLNPVLAREWVIRLCTANTHRRGLGVRMADRIRIRRGRGRLIRG
ncbi:thiol S-methyltransferase TMT1B isoform X2 [Rhipicephalus microplus]|uniref:thiol S-methyltransferase TMT1B isoform X2 n=1 Tax=Rhipicephalus microplus TaxID=6941 RepID=UPI003F6B571A